MAARPPPPLASLPPGGHGGLAAAGQASRVEAVLGAQRAFMDSYGDCLEQLLSVLVYLVPVQDEAGDVAGFWSQAVYSIIDLFGLYRTVLLRSPEALPVSDALAPGGAAGGLLRRDAAAESQLQRRRLTYTLAAFSLRTIRSLQVLLEMYAARVSGPVRALWVCLRVEMAKLLLKAVLCSRMPFAFYVDEEALEDVEPPKGQRSRQPGVPAAAEGGSIAPVSREPFVGRRSGRTLPGLRGPGAQAGALMRDRTAASGRIALAEALFHGRPVLHLLLLLRHGRKSWTAWLVALLVDQLSFTLLAPSVRPSPNTRAATLEWAELRRRRGLRLWALARSPAFDRLLKRPCELADSILQKIPIINLFRIMELILALQPFYFTSSGS